MKLRNKILIAISLAWLLFLGLTYIGSRFFLIRSFLALEHTRADEDLSRVDQALDQVDYALYTFTSDWAHWNDLYAYMQGKNPEFVPNNLNMTAYVNSNINLMTFWDKDQKLVLGTSIDTDNKKLIAYPKDLENYLYPGSALLDRKDVNKDLRGYILTENGIMLIAAVSITDGDKLLPPLGAMITARNLDQALVDKISETTKVTLKLFLPNQIKVNSSLKIVFDKTANEKSGHSSIPLSEALINGYTVIKDIKGDPIGMFRMTTPRTIYLSGVKAVNYYLTTFVVLGILFSLLMLWLLRVLIIKRLEKLDAQVADIGAKNAITQRVDASGRDELSSVSLEINHMLDIIQASHEQLEHRVQERTQELQKTNIQLQQEISERKSVERELIIHK